MLNEEPEIIKLDTQEEQVVLTPYGEATAKNFGLRVDNHKTVTNIHNVFLCCKALEANEHQSIYFDEFYQKIFCNGKEWTDKDTLNLLLLLQSRMGMTRVSKEMVENGVTAWANNNIRNEPKDWLESLQWDGQKRIMDFFIDYVGAKPSLYICQVSENFWISMPARIYEPGCQVDNMIILEGSQGIYKSKTLEIIGGKWHGAVQSNLDNKDFMLSMQGKLILEFADLDKFPRADVNALKNMITVRKDRYRVPFGRRTQDFPRQCIFTGTTNETTYLWDDTGGRRFWPVRTNNKPINIKAIEEVREQLFAEAVARYKMGTPWHIVSSEAQQEQEERRQQDPWEKYIFDYVENKVMVESSQILSDCLHIEPGKQTRAEAMRVGKILKMFGWAHKQYSFNDGRRWVYLKPIVEEE